MHATTPADGKTLIRYLHTNTMKTSPAETGRELKAVLAYARDEISHFCVYRSVPQHGSVACISRVDLPKRKRQLAESHSRGHEPRELSAWIFASDVARREDIGGTLNAPLGRKGEGSRDL